MSLRIDIDHVTEVLLADRWHIVRDTSFVIDAYEFIQMGEAQYPGDAEMYHAGGAAGICSEGFEFLEWDEMHPGDSSARVRVAGPLTSLLAVKTQR